MWFPGRKPERDEDRQNDVPDITKDLDDLEDKIFSAVSNVFSITGDIINSTSDVIATTSNHVRNDLKSWLTDESLPEDHISTQKVDILIDDLFRGNLSPFDKSVFSNDSFFNGDNVFSSIFQPLVNNGLKQGKTPFGLYAYPTPSPSLYNQCSKINGESLWDEYGYWRCLFPKSVIPDEFLHHTERISNSIMTKEDFEQNGGTSKIDTNGLIDFGSKGKFFKNFNDYLNWKTVMIENVEKEKLKHSRNLINSNKSYDNQITTVANKPEETEKRVTSTSKQVMYSSDNDLVTRTTKTEQRFSDGSLKITEIKKSKKPDQDNWDILENVHEYSSEDANKLSAHNDILDIHNHKGWFWNGKPDK